MTTLDRSARSLPIHVDLLRRPVHKHVLVGHEPGAAPESPDAANADDARRATEGDVFALRHQIMDQCHRSGDPLRVDEIAGEVAQQAPLGAVCAVVSDLLEEGLLRVEHDEQLPLDRVEERLKWALQGFGPHRPTQTGKILVLGPERETETFLDQVGADEHFALDADVQYAARRLEPDLQLLLVAASYPALRTRFAQLVHGANAVMVLVSSDSLHQARDCVDVLRSHTVDFHIVVHLADEETDLEADQVHEALGAHRSSPVVMVDVHSPSAPTTVLRDVTLWANDENGART